MTIINTPPADYPTEITGYVEPWIAEPGGQLEVKVSCTEPEYSYRVVRVIQGVDIAHSPEQEIEEIASVRQATIKGRFQLARCGSYARVDQWYTSEKPEHVQATLYFQPHLVRAQNPQAIISTLDVSQNAGFAIVISKAGAVELWLGVETKVEVIETCFVPIRQRWVKAELVLRDSNYSILLEPIPRGTEKVASAVRIEGHLANNYTLSTTLLFAGTYARSPTSAFPRVTNFFNGRIDSPIIKSLGPQSRVLVQYDFARNISEDTILDTSGAGRDGILVNAPTRAVTGYDWDGSELNWTKAKYGYGAIHFHEDDLDDAEWETDFTVAIPSNARSGIYAVHVESTNGKTSDMIAFIVRPTRKSRQNCKAKVALVLSTFTYLAYANEKFADTNRSSSGGTGGRLYKGNPVVTEDFRRGQRRLDAGLSTYDVHNDGSGTVYSSAKRPIFNFRPGYVMYGLARPRELSAESIMIGYLEHEKIPYEVLTDHDLHFEGVSALLPYDTIITGSHPEYPTTESYDAYERYARRGGNLMYLGGNGFYWVTAINHAHPWRIEVRRGAQGVRSFAMDPGELVMSTNGKFGTLWRTHGRSSHALFGVAFCAAGRPPGVPFRRTEAGHSAKFEWMFAGISEDELIGEHGLGGGASGDEMDSFDIAEGSPLDAIVVATTTGHPDGFSIATECRTYPIVDTLGSQTKDIRSDMVYYETNGGGAVFSVGSINWYCSLGWNNYDNNVARLTGNIIKEFLRRGTTRN